MAIRISRYRAVVGRDTRVNIGDTLSFIEDGDFTQQFRDCGLNDDDLEIVQVAGATVTIRFVYFEQDSTVLLLAAYFGDAVKPMTSVGASTAESYITAQLAIFGKRHTR